MKSYAWLAVVGLTFGCTKPNPKDCADGLCTDAAYPFCDIDGALAGEAKTCIAVSCTPSEFEACRGDTSIVCNTAGNDYDLVQCEKGCDPMHGCRACTSAAECANPTPVCDDTSQCRACEVDDECKSMVCEGGSCVAESGIVYASPTGADTAACTLADPCSITRVQAVALSGAIPPLVRILPGPYVFGIAVSSPTSAPVRFVATGATIGASKAVHVHGGANVEIRGLTAVGATNGVSCGSAGATTTLVISDSIVSAGGAGTVPVYTEQNCALRMLRTEVKPSSDKNAVSLGSGSTFDADRLLIRGSQAGHIGALGERFAVRITNSVLDNVAFIFVSSDSGSPGSVVRLGFNTIRVEANASLDCSVMANLTHVLENNIVVATNVANALTGNGCSAKHNVLFPQQSPAATNIAADPQFVDADAKDLHLKPTSPAVDAALPDVFPATTDFDGTSRPQGAQADIGAFERKP